MLCSLYGIQISIWLKRIYVLTNCLLGKYTKRQYTYFSRVFNIPSEIRNQDLNFKIKKTKNSLS